MLLTATVLTALWRAAKKNGSAWRRIAYQLKEQKSSGLKQNTLVIEGFKCGLLFCLFVQKTNLAPTVKSANFQKVFPLDTNRVLNR
jgi:hypothetical protein